MDIRQITSALAVSRFRSFSEAAEHTSFSQSAVSKQINNLEAELGVKIFDRRQQSQSALPTELGREVLRRLEKIALDYNDLCLLAKNNSVHEKISISLGSAPAFGSFGEDVLMADFAITHPEYELYHLIGGSFMLTDMVKSSRIDAVVIAVGTILWPEQDFRDFLSTNRCIAVPLISSRLNVGMSKSNPLAGRESVTLADLKDETILLRNPHRPSDPTFYPSKHEDFMTLCRNSGFVPRIRSVDDYSGKLRIQMIARGGGVMLNTSRVTMPYRDIVFIPIEPRPYPITSYFVALRDNASPALAALLEAAEGIGRENGFSDEELSAFLA